LLTCALVGHHASLGAVDGPSSVCPAAAPGRVKACQRSWYRMGLSVRHLLSRPNLPSAYRSASVQMRFA